MGHFEIHRIGDLLVVSAVGPDTSEAEEEPQELEIAVNNGSATEERAFRRRITLRGWLLRAAKANQ